MSSPTPYFTKTIKSAHTFLSRWKGADAEMWELTKYHKSLDIVIRRQGENENLLIACLGPITIKGPIKWMNCDLQVTATTLPGGRETGFLVADVSVGLEV